MATVAAILLNSRTHPLTEETLRARMKDPKVSEIIVWNNGVEMPNLLAHFDGITVTSTRDLGEDAILAAAFLARTSHVWPDLPRPPAPPLARPREDIFARADIARYFSLTPRLSEPRRYGLPGSALSALRQIQKSHSSTETRALESPEIRDPVSHRLVQLCDRNPPDEPLPIRQEYYSQLMQMKYQSFDLGVRGFLNRVYGSNPGFIHAPGTQTRNQPFWSRTVDLAFKTPVTALDDKVTVLTCGDQTDGIFERLCRTHGVPLVKLGGELPPDRWSNLQKIRLVADYVETVKTPYVLYCDNHDVVFMDPFRQLSEKFESLRREWVFGAEEGLFPRDLAHLRAQQTLSGGCRWEFLNSGLWMGKTAYLRTALRTHLVPAMQSPHPKQPQSDQYIFTKAYLRDSANVGLDFRCVIFQNTNIRKDHLGRSLGPNPHFDPRYDADDRALRSPRRLVIVPKPHDKEEFTDPLRLCEAVEDVTIIRTRRQPLLQQVPGLTDISVSRAEVAPLMPRVLDLLAAESTRSPASATLS